MPSSSSSSSLKNRLWYINSNFFFCFVISVWSLISIELIRHDNPTFVRLSSSSSSSYDNNTSDVVAASVISISSSSSSSSIFSIKIFSCHQSKTGKRRRRIAAHQQNYDNPDEIIKECSLLEKDVNFTLLASSSSSSSSSLTTTTTSSSKSPFKPFVQCLLVIQMLPNLSFLIIFLYFLIFKVIRFVYEVFIIDDDDEKIDCYEKIDRDYCDQEPFIDDENENENKNNEKNNDENNRNKIKNKSSSSSSSYIKNWRFFFFCFHLFFILFPTIISCCVWLSYNFDECQDCIRFLPSLSTSSLSSASSSSLKSQGYELNKSWISVPIVLTLSLLQFLFIIIFEAYLFFSSRLKKKKKNANENDDTTEPRENNNYVDNDNMDTVAIEMNDKEDDGDESENGEEEERNTTSFGIRRSESQALHGVAAAVAGGGASSSSTNNDTNNTEIKNNNTKLSSIVESHQRTSKDMYETHSDTNPSVDNDTNAKKNSLFSPLSQNTNDSDVSVFSVFSSPQVKPQLETNIVRRRVPMTGDLSTTDGGGCIDGSASP